MYCYTEEIQAWPKIYRDIIINAGENKNTFTIHYRQSIKYTLQLMMIKKIWWNKIFVSKNISPRNIFQNLIIRVLYTFVLYTFETYDTKGIKPKRQLSFLN